MGIENDFYVDKEMTTEMSDGELIVDCRKKQVCEINGSGREIDNWD